VLIVTLSTIPPRFDRIGPTLQSILRQDNAPDRVLLYIPKRYRRFPNWDGALPSVPDGVEIRRPQEDLGPATKILPAIRDFEGQEVELLFCDDDRAYPPDWTARFLAARRAHPDSVLCIAGRHAETMAVSTGANRMQPRAVRRWRLTDWRFQLHYLSLQLKAGRKNIRAPHRKVYKRSGYVDIFEGFGGVMVQPQMLQDPTAFQIPAVLWAVDDVWLSGMLAQAGVPIWLEANIPDPPETSADDEAPLHAAVIDGAGRNEANAIAVQYMQETYGVWL
jgi:hypothetical protein